MRSSVDFWNFLISLRETVPGLNLWVLLTPPVVARALPFEDLAATAFLGCLVPVAFLAVCLVLAILINFTLLLINILFHRLYIAQDINA